MKLSIITSSILGYVFAAILMSGQLLAGRTDLINAAQNGDLNEVRSILAKGTDVNIHTKSGFTALMMASQKGHTEVVKELLAKGADMNRQAKNGATALMLAATTGQPEVVRELLGNGADVNIKAKDGKDGSTTALFWASQEGHTAIVKELLANGADMSIKASNGITPLMVASEVGHLGAVREMLAKGADPNIKTKDGEYTALILASKNNHKETANLLMEAGAKSADSSSIQFVQSKLSELGYDPGPIDGLMGSKTRTAINEFQRNAGLPRTGAVTEKLVQELNAPCVTKMVDFNAHQRGACKKPKEVAPGIQIMTTSPF